MGWVRTPALGCEALQKLRHPDYWGVEEMNDGIVLAGALRLVGRSVFANRFMAADQLVMQAPTIQLDAEQYRALRAVRLDQYCMAHPVDPDGALLPLSEAALCLVSEEPSLIATAANVGASGWIVEFHAARDIREGEELGRRDQIDRWRVE